MAVTKMSCYMQEGNRIIRRATLPEDAEGIMAVFSAAKAIMVASGNANLWKEGYQRLNFDLSCSVDRFSADIDARTYIEGFRRTDYFIKLCQQCGNYNRRYGCPPFDDSTLAVVSDYEKVRVIGVKITPNYKRLPLKMANDLMEPVITKLNEELLELEQSLGGYAFGFVGSCPYCGGAPCARIKGKPCRHPEKVRPSLEAFGFDMSKTAKDLLGLEIKWSQGEIIPEYLTLVCGVFYQKSL